jgi:hypothetical protein
VRTRQEAYILRNVTGTKPQSFNYDWGFLLRKTNEEQVTGNFIYGGSGRMGVWR